MAYLAASWAEQGTAGALAAGQSIMSISGRQLTGTSATSYLLCNVPSGYTWYITDVVLTTASSNEVDMTITSTLTNSQNTNTISHNVIRLSILATDGCQAGGIESQPSIASGAAIGLSFPSGATSTADVDFFISGFLQ